MSPLAALLVALAAETERRLEAPIPANASHVIASHSFGDVTVKNVPAGEAPRAQLVLVATSSDGTSAELEKQFLNLVQLSVSSEADAGHDTVTTTVRSVFPDKNQQPSSISFAATLTLFLPEPSAVAIDNRYGNVSIDGRGGDVSVSSLLGAVDARRVSGTVHVAAQFGAVTIADVTGDLFVDGTSAPVTAERVKGHVDVKTNSGLVRVDDVGSARVENRVAPVELANVRGDAKVTAPFCAVKARNVGGGLTIDGNNESIVVDGVGGDLTIQHRIGRIEARHVKGRALVQGNLSDVTLIDVDGNAEVHSPNAPVRIERVAGSVVAENSGRALEVIEPRGDVKASGRGGKLTLKLGKPGADGKEHTITLETTGPAIELELADDASCALELTSGVGQIECAFDGMQFVQKGAARVGTLTLGGGLVKLHATCVGGAIRVRRTK